VESNLLFLEENELGIGEVERFNIKFQLTKNNPHIQHDDLGQFIWLRVRNRENNLFRPIYITGPFALYIDVTPVNYSHKESFDEEIQYNADIKPGQSFRAKLRINKNSLIEEGWYGWTIDIVSQLTLNTRFHINFVLMIGYDYHFLGKTHKGAKANESPCQVRKLSTTDLWTAPPPMPDHPVHLVILTHGIFSNIGADMLYLRDRILQDSPENVNVIVRGYDGNVGKSEKGVRYLGKRVAEYVMALCEKLPYSLEKISFIGHSLGGPVQAYAIAHIVTKDPDFFKRIKPINLITLASPMLGITEFPKAVSWALDLGMLGKTGRDLTLRHKFPSLMKKSRNFDDAYRKFTTKPVLEQIMVNKAAHKVFTMFEKHTLYANAIHDGIVPLRTSALMYLDWKGLDDIETLKKKYEEETKTASEETAAHDNTKGRTDTVPDIPEVDEEAVNSGSKSESDLQQNSPHFRELKPKSATTSFISGASKSRKFKKMRKYIRTQTVQSPTSEDSSEFTHSSEINDGGDGLEMNIPPVASTVLTAAIAIISPEPAQSFLCEPSTRFPAIFHDRVYSFADLPPQHYRVIQKVTGPLAKLVSRNKKALQEFIARAWHKDMEWRKVLVTLRPDAHNNITVRRRYVNAWGWEVVDHLVEHHFSEN
jgi:pimeloyl-ACP methyl ester carboxylesterase